MKSKIPESRRNSNLDDINFRKFSNMLKNTPEICIKPKALGVSEIYRNQLQ